MHEFTYWATKWLGDRAHDGWTVVDGLNRQEWLVVLACVTAIGFLCMRGFGSRTGY